MKIFYKEHQKILHCLLNHQVEFILIGGYAINYYGYNRTTGDMDIWLKPDNTNKERLINALRSMNFEDEGLEIISTWDFTIAQKFYIGEKNQPDRTDFMTQISGINYSEAEKEVKEFETDGLRLPLIHINHLIINKKSSGRLKDLADVEKLEKILQIRKG
jgi:predicted nucleotidyltransferase